MIETTRVVRFGVLGVLAASLVVMGGCWSTPSPDIMVVGVTATDRTPDGTLLNIELEAQSTAEEQLPLKEVRYRVLLDGREVFSGLRSPEATLRRFGTQRLFLPAVVPAGVADQGAYEVEGTLTYIEPGTIAEVLFDFGVRMPKVSFTGAGSTSVGIRAVGELGGAGAAGGAGEPTPAGGSSR